MTTRIGVLLDNIRFEHTIFALPFAYLGMILAAGGLPTAWQFIWITIAMGAARTLAMSMNRLIDAELDARNPRTAGRPIPTGKLKRRDVLLFSLVSLAILTFAAAQLNWLCVLLLPLAVVILVGYSYTKRFTWLCHAVLGLADGGAAVGGWIAVTGQLAWEPFVLGMAVATWIGGFDLIYACQDVEIDRREGLHSVAARWGCATSLTAAKVSHAFTIGFLALAGVMLSLAWPYWIGVALAAVLLAYENSLVKPDDLSRLDVAFFNVNGYIAVIVFVFTAASVWVR